MVELQFMVPLRLNESMFSVMATSSKPSVRLPSLLTSTMSSPSVRFSNTPANSYWLLKRPLYGLKRSLRHWFQKVTKLLIACGLYPTLNDLCLFKGKPDGVHDLYLGLYVDGFIYFSPNLDTETTFEYKLKFLTNINLMGQISHFLGINFDWRHQEDNHLDVYLS